MFSTSLDPAGCRGQKVCANITPCEILYAQFSAHSALSYLQVTCMG